MKNGFLVTCVVFDLAQYEIKPVDGRNVKDSDPLLVEIDSCWKRQGRLGVYPPWSVDDVTRIHSPQQFSDRAAGGGCSPSVPQTTDSLLLWRLLFFSNIILFTRYRPCFNFFVALREPDDNLVLVRDVNLFYINGI